MEGPRATYRKARTKLGERSFTGDLHVVVLTGRVTGDGTPVVALACRVPPAAEYLPVHEALMHTVKRPLEPTDLEAFARAVERHVEDLQNVGSQSYLYSGKDPPESLVDAVRRAVLTNTAALKEDELGAVVTTIPFDPEPPSTALWRWSVDSNELGIPAALLGAGDYARTQILPSLAQPGIRLIAVCDREPQIAALVANETAAALATTDAEEAIAALPAPGVVFVATYHDSHAELAARALDAGHRVFLEKPTVVTEEDLAVLMAAVARNPGRLEVGFNRRSNSLVRRARRLLAEEDGPMTISCVVREVSLEASHWYLWPNQGTRITGNLCHWFDLAVHLMEAGPIPDRVVVSPPVCELPERADEERTVTVTFDDGSMLTVVATGRGDDIRGVQEAVEARRGALTVRLDDLWKLRFLRNGRERMHRTLWRDKGHGAMFDEALERLRAGRPSAYPIRDLIVVAVIQIAASRLSGEGGGSAAIALTARDWLERAAPGSDPDVRRGSTSP